MSEATLPAKLDGPLSAYDFIDIDALLRNVAMSVWREAEEFEEKASA